MVDDVSSPENDSAPVNEDQVLVNRYKIISRLGTGGSSTVFKADDLVLKRLVAVKLLKSGQRSTEQLVRLQREARAICQLSHKNIIEVYDFIVAEGNVPILAMEYIEGAPLDEVLTKNGPLSLDAALTVFEQICEALSYAHEHGITHRDLKPSNILVQNKDRFNIKIIDFGIAKLNDEDGSLTASGLVVGTPAYLSPEQALCERVIDHRADIYSLGCLMFKCLTGRAVFPGSMMETLHAHINETPPTLKQGNPDRDYPEELERIVEKTLAKHPDDRFQNMREVNSALAAVKMGRTEPEKSEELPSVSEKGDNSPAHNLISEPQVRELRFQILVLPAVLFLACGLAILLILRLTNDSFQSVFPADSDLSDKKHSDPVKSPIKTEKVNQKVWHIIENPINPQKLKELEGLGVKRLRLSRTDFSDEHVALIQGLDLIIIDLRNTKITDNGLAQLANAMPNLQGLLLDRCQGVTHAGIKELSKFHNLKILSLKYQGISNEDLETIKKLRELRLLYVDHSEHINDESIEKVLELKKLVSIRLDGTRVSAAGISRLRALPSLIFIGMGACNIDKNNMPKLSNKITMLDFSRNKNLRYMDIEPLLTNPRLWYLDITGCDKITEDGAAVGALRQHFDMGKAQCLIVSPKKISYEFYLDPEFYPEEFQELTVADRQALYINQIDLTLDIK